MYNKSKKRIMTLLITISLLLAMMAIFPSVSAASTCACTSDTPGYISASSAKTSIIKMAIQTDDVWVSGVYLERIKVNFSGSGFTTSDLAALSDDENSGVQLWRDYDDDGVFDGSPSDGRCGPQPTWQGNQCVFVPNNNLYTKLTQTSTDYIFFVVIRTSGTVSDDNYITAEAIEALVNNTASTISGTSNVTTIADTQDPVVPSNALTAPNGAEQWAGSQTITWNNSDITDSHFNSTPIALYYSSNGGSSWNLIGSGEANDGSFTWDTTSVADGSNYLINITATDNASNSGYDISNATFTIDNAAPTCTIGYNRSATYFAAGTSIKIWANFTETGSGMDNSTVNISISTAGNGGVSSTLMNKSTFTSYYYNWTNTPAGSDDDGAFTVSITAKDNASNDVSPNPKTDNSKIIDNTGTTATITTPDDDSSWYQSMNTISGTCSDALSGPGSVNITIYNATSNKYWNFSAGWAPGVNWTSTTVAGDYATWSFDAQTEGVTWWNGSHYIINATAIDNVSNAGAAYSNDFYLDTNGLASNLTSISTYWQTASPININFTASDTGGSGLNSVALYYRYSSDNSTWDAWVTYGTADSSPWNPTAWSFDFTTNGSGYYEFYSKATDNVSNVEDAPVANGNDTICSYDPDAPTGTIIYPANGGYYKSGDGIQSKINGTVNDPRNVTNAYIEVRDNTNDTFFTGTGWQSTYTNISTNITGTAPSLNWIYNHTINFPTWAHNHTYYINLSAVDTAGNWNNDTATASFLYDTENPTAEVTIPADNDWLNTLANITGNASDDGESGVSLVNITIYNQTGNKHWTGTAWTGTATNLSANLSGTGNNINWYYSNTGAFPTWTNGSTYLINASSTDNASNIGSWDSNTLNIDTDDLASSVTAISAYWQISSPLSISFNASDAGSGLKNVTLYYRYSATNLSGSWGAWTAHATVDTDPWDPTAWSFDFTASGGRGYYLFRSQAIDNASNSETVSGNDTMCSYDDTNPFVNITYPVNATYYTDVNSITGNCFDSGPSGVKEVNITIYNSSSGKYWNGADWANGKNWTGTTLSAANTLWSYTATSVTWQNAVYYLINATATDNATRTSTQKSINFTIDTTTPTVTIAFDSATTYFKEADTLKIFANFTETGSGMNHSTVKITVDTSGTDVSNQPMSMTNNTHWYYTWTVPAGSDGNVNISIAGQDNVSQSITGSSTYNTSKYIDNIAPTFITAIEFNNTETYYNETDVVKIFANFTEAGSGINEDTVKITITNITGGITVLNNSLAMTKTDNTHWYFDWHVPSDQNCNVNISVEATDNVSLSLSGTNYTLTKYIDNMNPTGDITHPADNSYKDEAFVNITGNATDNLAGVATVTITLYNKTGGKYFDGSSWADASTNLNANLSSDYATWYYSNTGAFPTWLDGNNYTVNLTITDNASNTNTGYDSNFFYYDEGGPTIASVLITDITTGSTTYIKNGDTFNITATVTDANLASGDTQYIKADLTALNGSATAQADGYDGTTAYWNGTVSTFANTTITVTINASDKSGNYATEVNDTIVQDDTAPTFSYAVMDADNDGGTYSYVDIVFSETTMDHSTIAYTDFSINLTGISPTAVQNNSNDRLTLKFDDKFETGCSPYISAIGAVHDLAGNNISGTVTINTYRISLSQGWNIFSIPADPGALTISTIFPDDFESNVSGMYSYDSATDTWSYWADSSDDAEFTLEPGKGYWIQMSTADTLIGNYDLWPVPGGNMPEVTIVAQSWNLIGHWWTYNTSATTSAALRDFSDSDISSVYKYSNAGESYTDVFNTGNMEPGVGYWLKFKGTSNKDYSP